MRLSHRQADILDLIRSPKEREAYVKKHIPSIKRLLEERHPLGIGSITQSDEEAVADYLREVSTPEEKTKYNLEADTYAEMDILDDVFGAL